MKLPEIMKILPSGDTVFVTTANNDLLYEGKVCDVGAETLEAYKDAEVSMLSPDWQEEIIIVILP